MIALPIIISIAGGIGIIAMFFSALAGGVTIRFTGKDFVQGMLLQAITFVLFMILEGGFGIISAAFLVYMLTSAAFSLNRIGYTRIGITYSIFSVAASTFWIYAAWSLYVDR